ncbi:UDP-glucose 4-epimerase family protein [Chromobacterium subtsugae]|uniref:UDP-glucose 4-epimerase family protein n=1 Tax=Chromobacterium subtsugae TaxID=251747 RepID=UPI0006418110|nr:SDR family oxidoreductase [Chromobacterium subtsugae]
MKALITGADGFVGRDLVQTLLHINNEVIPTSRSGKNGCIATGDLSENYDWCQILTDCDVVIHLAARVHQMHDTTPDPLSEFRRVNTSGTLHLARQAISAGVKRFVFISSVKVNGEESAIPYSENSSPQPSDPYALSKWEAEQGLLQLAKESTMEIVIIRPPLVYGPGVKGNFLSLIKIVQYGIPLPFKSIKNLRSLVGLSNLVDFIILCADRNRSPKAAGQVFLISDGSDISTPELIEKVSTACNLKPKLICFPPLLLNLIATFMRKKEAANRLLGSLQVDITKARSMLGWQPIMTMDQQLRQITNKK